MPERPSRSAAQNSHQVWPAAEITPIPVTTTRRCISRPDGGWAPLAGVDQLGDSIHDIAHRPNVLRGIVGNINIELALHGKQNIDAIQRINAEFLKRALGCDLFLGDVLR